MYSYAHIGDMDFSFNWKKHWQQSEGSSKVFSLNEWRGRSWNRNLWFTKWIAVALNHIDLAGLAAEDQVRFLSGNIILHHFFMSTYIGAAAFVEVKEAISGGLDLWNFFI